jgi:hypothetical protein
MLNLTLNSRSRFVAIPALAMAIGLSACTHPTVAQTQYNDVPVLVVGEDEDRTSVKRSSDIFKRVLAQLKHSMKRSGFRMVDEESVAADLGWRSKDRRPKSELLQVAKLMSKSGKASHRVRAIVMFRIHASGKSLGALTKVQTRIDGEIYDIVSNEFLDTFEMPRQEYPAPADCLDTKICMQEVVGDRAREIAGSLGAVLAKKLARYHSDSTGGSASNGAIGGESGRSGGGAHGLLTPYTVTLRYFDTREALSIIGVMSDEFPGYKSHTMISKAPVLRKYEYVTSAKSHKMEEWLNVLLIDMGFNVDKQVEIMMQGSDIIIEKIVTTRDRKRSDDEKARFK